MCMIGLLLALILTQGCAAEVSHPVYEATATEASVPSLEARVAELMAMSDDELRDFVPEVNGFLFCGCPNCTMGTQEGQISWKGIADPDKAACRYCGMEYPNEKYPETQTKTGTNFKGETVTYKYYQGPDGTQYFFTGRIDYDRKGWLASRAYDLAQLYAVTRDPKYAHKAVVLIDALADAYSHWCVHFDWPFRDKGPVKPEPPFPTAGGMWNRWFYTDVPIPVIKAYDLVVDSGAVETLSGDIGVDVKKRIEDDFFRFSIWFVRTYKELYSNMSPGIYEGMIVAGRVLGEPEYVHDGVTRWKGLLTNKFFYDGFWEEGSISYHDQTINWLSQVAATARGYSDPEGFISEIDGARYDDLDLMVQFPLARRALGMNRRFVYPDGHIVPSHDAWAKSQRTALTQSEPWILPGMGHAILGCGQGPTQVQAQLHFSGGYGHQHRDNLHLSLFAEGHELLPDLGYTHTKYRAWTVSTPAHNTVAIDEGEHGSSGHTCNLLLWAPQVGPAQVVEAEARASYPDVAEEFQRMAALVQVDDARAYVLDVFRVTGGNQHDYLLHGSADADQVAESSADLSPVTGSLLGEGVEFSLPSVGEQDNGTAEAGRNVNYGFIDDLTQGETDESFDVRFRFADGGPVTYTGTFLGAPGTTIALGDAPSIRRAGEEDTKVADFRMPVLAVRRRTAGMAGAFVAIHRGWKGEDFIQSAKPLPGMIDAPGVLGLVVEHAAGTDVIFACTEEGQAQGVRIEGRAEPVCDARFGIVRWDTEGKLVSAGMVGGTILDHNGVRLTAGGPQSGTVTGVRHDGDAAALEVSGELSEGEALAGRTILVKHGDLKTQGHTIRRVEKTAAGSLVWLESDPGFVMEEGTVRFTMFPQGEFEGENTYRVDNVVSLEQTDSER